MAERRSALVYLFLGNQADRLDFRGTDIANWLRVMSSRYCAER